VWTTAGVAVKPPASPMKAVTMIRVKTGYT
jgi:hypothetical protein